MDRWIDRSMDRYPKSLKNRRKSHPNQPKIVENRTQIDPKSVPNHKKSDPGTQWGPPGRPRGPSERKVSKKVIFVLVCPGLLGTAFRSLGGHFGPGWPLGADFWENLCRKLVFCILAPLCSRLPVFEVSGGRVGASWLSFGRLWVSLGTIWMVKKLVGNLVGKKSRKVVQCCAEIGVQVP